MANRSHLYTFDRFEGGQPLVPAAFTSGRTPSRKQLPWVAAIVDARLEAPPEQLFAKAPKWLDEVEKDWTSADLGLGRWSSILYYSLDRN